MKRPFNIAITTGDHDGIGTEVVAKALRTVGPKNNVQFFLWRSPNCPSVDLKRIDSKFKRVTVTGWPEALRISGKDPKELIDINSPLPPAKWVETSAHAAIFGNLDALATGPLSKTSIVNAGLNDLGHTDILKRVSKAPYVHMAFVGQKFTVVLATGHLPIEKVPSDLTVEQLESTIKAAALLLPSLDKSLRKKPMAVLGLNPHAGEQGLIGQEERDVVSPAIERLKSKGYNLVGPLVPDAAFLKSDWSKYALFICCYHDQGLIPFKMVHGHKGVHLSLGLPFIRTSVDHGTAKNIFGQNKADYSSMVEAIEWAVSLCKARGEFK